MKLELNQKVYVVWNQCYQPKEVTITKIGRKYAHTDNRLVVIDIEKLTCGSSPTTGRIYANKEAFEAQKNKNDLWDSFRKKVTNAIGFPEHLSAEQIQSICSAF